MATLAKNLLRHPLFWGVLFAHALVYFLYGSAIDTDGAAAKDINFSAYIAFTKIITVLSIASLMPFVYGAFLAASVTIHFRARNWPAAIFFANPFVIYNACDVFNRFVLSLALASWRAPTSTSSRGTTASLPTGSRP